MYAIINKRKEYLSRKGIDSECIFTDNYNFAYVFKTIEESERVKSFAERFFNQDLEIITI